MVANLDQCLPLLRYLNTKQGPSQIENISSDLHLTADEIKLVLEEINNILANTIAYSQAGIALKRRLDLLDQNILHQRTKGKGRIILIDHIDSTNTLMLKYCKNIVSGDVIIAEIQTRGRGRRDRVWHGFLGHQLTFSLAHRFHELKSTVGLSVAVGAMIAKTLDELGFDDIALKWPNDIYYRGKKLGGILIETMQDHDGVTSVIGIGLNIYRHEDMSEDFSALYKGFKASLRLSRNDIAVALVNEIRSSLVSFNLGHCRDFIEVVRRFDYLKGREIEIKLDNKVKKANVLGIDDKGELVVMIKNNTLHLSSGHILKVL